MYKLKYYYLSKEEKKELKEKFINTEFGKNLYKRLNRLSIIGLIGFIFSIYLFFTIKNLWDIILSIVLLIASITFIIASYKIKIVKLNDHLILQKKSSKK